MKKNLKKSDIETLDLLAQKMCKRSYVDANALIEIRKPSFKQFRQIKMADIQMEFEYYASILDDYCGSMVPNGTRFIVKKDHRTSYFLMDGGFASEFERENQVL